VILKETKRLRFVFFLYLCKKNDTMRIISTKISMEELQKMAHHFFGDMVKGVVDVEQQVLAVDAELHADLESLLLEKGHQQEHLWGINLYPFLGGNDFLEFDSMINIRPAQNNRGRGVESIEIQEQIKAIINQIVEK